MSDMAGQGIFISYRRADSASMAGRVREHLREGLPDRRVFLDVESIDPGANFEHSIRSELEQCNVMLVLVGKAWMSDDGGQLEPRISDPSDYVRREITWALEAGIRIIPVLIDDARMPDTGSLPSDIREFAMKNAVELRNSRFEDDVSHLLKTIDPRHRPIDRGRSSRVRTIIATIAGAFTGLLVLFALLVVHQGLTQEPISTRIGLWGAVLLVPASLLIGAFVAWHVQRRRSGIPGR